MESERFGTKHDSLRSRLIVPLCPENTDRFLCKREYVAKVIPLEFSDCAVGGPLGVLKNSVQRQKSLKRLQELLGRTRLAKALLERLDNRMGPVDAETNRVLGGNLVPKRPRG